MMPARVVSGISLATAMFGWIMWRTWKSVESAEPDSPDRRRILLRLGSIYVVSAVIAVAAVLHLESPRNQTMLVAYIQGDVFSHSAGAQVWKYGQGIECVLASGSLQFPPDTRGDVLLCGDRTQLAWSQVWLRSDTKDQVYDAARMLEVTFRGTGRGRRGWGASWSCKRLPESIDCD